MTANVCKKITAQLTGAIGKQEDVSVQLEALDILSDMLSRYQRISFWQLCMAGGCRHVFAFDFCISLILLRGIKNKGFGLAATGECLSRADSPAGMRDNMLSLSVLGSSSDIGDGSHRGSVQTNVGRERAKQGSLF